MFYHLKACFTFDAVVSEVVELLTWFKLCEDKSKED
jgi:hypothetical protein